MKISAILKGIQKLGISSLILSVMVLIYNGYVRPPNIMCTINDSNTTMTFFIKEEYRNVNIKLHPQLVVQFDDYIILSIYLENYFQEEFVQFIEMDAKSQCQAYIQHVKYVDKLIFYMTNEVINRVSLHDRGISEELARRLKIYVSVLCGISYETKEGNEEKRFCIIVQDGIVRDYEVDSPEITNRLYETSLRTQDDLMGIESDMEIENMILVIAEEIGKLYY